MKTSVDGRSSFSGALDTDTAVGVVAGVGQPGDGDRFFLGYEDYRLGDQDDLAIIAPAYQHFLAGMEAVPGMPLRPFLGAQLGYGWLDRPAAAGLDAASDSHVTYGLSAGLNLQVGAQAEVEAGLRYNHIGLAVSRQGSAGSDRLQVDADKGWWLGFNLGL